MKCIVTAGPTYEELDEVRRLTNFSTGTLGTELANFLTARGHEVELFRGYYSTCQIEPVTKRTQVFTTTADLRRRLQKVKKTDAVFHAAAVSDFAFGKIWSRTASGKLRPLRSPKISTRMGPLLAELVATPKIISELRGWFPNALLAGWKYELEGTRSQAVVRAEQQLIASKTDVCVVNGRAYGAGFGLVTGPNKCRNLRDKKSLFDALHRILTSQTS